LQDIIIQQLKNPQKLQRFMIDDNDIAPDIKKADKDLKNEYEKEKVMPFLQEMMTEVNQEPNRKEQINKAYRDGDRESAFAIGYYNFSDDENQRKALINTLKSNDAIKTEFNLECNAIRKDFENCKKEKIVPKTHENIDARRRQVQGQGYKRQRLSSNSR